MKKKSEPNEIITPRVLIVDDEINILHAMKRLLRSNDFELNLATSGEDALNQLKSENVDLIISDMKMPGMSGAQLFSEIATLYPDTYRILLTGFADIDSTIKAINDGKIHRYIQKPWNNEALIEAINEGLEKIKLKQQNTQLQALLEKQNRLLRNLNANLEEKVEARTKQIKLALTRIEQDHKATQKVLYNLVSVNPNLDGAFANSVSLLAKRLAKSLSLPEEQISAIAFASLISEVGLLGLESSLFTQPFSSLNFNQKEDYFEQTNVTQLLLSPAEHLHSVSDIIRYQFEQYNGNGPHKLAENKIPIGSKILSVARDYWLYSFGRLTGSKMSAADVRITMKKFSGTKYDEKILDILLKNPDFASSEFIESPVQANSIEPGMVLKHNIFTDNHMLLLAEGHIFTESTVAKLMHFEKAQKHPLSIIIDEQ
ncbi:response regulator [Paraglaciecola aquimarina]|uniref:Response regulator n=1 Tax=Paraglaciecola algarum TaxID=3050085 RepID=A0ABS9DBX4_9ALTE|nr:response regulator [Paraglaciecola sp. G1-23]MCF2950429.1 response regulator [Paraglaciecola sp. G1-23]